MTATRRTFLLSTLAALGPAAAVAGAGPAKAKAKSPAPAPTPVVLKGVVRAKGTMGPFHFTVEGAGRLLPDAPEFTLTSSVPVTSLAAAKPVLTLESPKGKITVQVTQEVSVKEKSVVPFAIVGGTAAYAHAAGSGRIKIELIERSGFNGTVRLTFLRPAPVPTPGAKSGSDADEA